MTGPLNGKTGEYARWVITLVAAALVSYFAFKERVAALDQREQDHFEAVQQTLKMMDRNNDQRFSEIKNYFDFIYQTGADAKTGEPYRVQGQPR